MNTYQLTAQIFNSTELKRLQRKNGRHRTDADVFELTTLPASNVAMETAAQKAREELGDPEFQQIRQNTSWFFLSIKQHHLLIYYLLSKRPRVEP